MLRAKKVIDNPVQENNFNVSHRTKISQQWSFLSFSRYKYALVSALGKKETHKVGNLLQMSLNGPLYFVH